MPSIFNNYSEEFWGPKRKAGRLLKESVDADGQGEVKTKSKRGKNKNKNNRRKGQHNNDDGKEGDDEGNGEGEDNRGVGVGGDAAMELESSVGAGTGTVEVVVTETGNHSSILGNVCPFLIGKSAGIARSHSVAEEAGSSSSSLSSPSLKKSRNLQP